ncbi:MAG: hypothetical protein CL608_20935 [Anaerolineaceae bacterium]|nr:hypothetical protein [Anaerolineaceae bacterium]
MAVTQQIVRLHPNLLQLCSISEEVLKRLISLQLQSEDGHLDLNWAPSGLERYFEASQQLPESKLALYLALNGSRLVNNDHRCGPDYDPVYSDITALSREEVDFVANNLSKIDWESFFGWLPEDKEEANKILGTDLTIHPNTYHGDYLKELVTFYQKASKDQMVTAMWWD